MAAAALVRRADAVGGSTAMELGTPERVEFHLAQWALWKRGGETAALWSGGGGTPEYRGSSSVEDLERQMDARCARVVDTVVADLSRAHPAQASAIDHAYLHAVYRFSERYPFRQALADAKQAVGRGLSRKGIY